MDPNDREKTAFSPGPGMGSFEFSRMPFGLCGAPSSFQRLMDKVMRGLPFVSTYIDDVLIHSTDDEMHAKHLNEVFMRLRKAGLTLRGKKCVIGTPQVTYLGHHFTGSGVTPDREKVKAVEEWPIPQNATEVRQFLGLASYYRRFIQNFADVAAPLHNLTQKDVLFSWNNDCSRAFKILKCKLIGAPILVYPRVDKEASQFQLQTDASALGLGAVLEQGGGMLLHMLAESWLKLRLTIV